MMRFATLLLGLLLAAAPARAAEPWREASSRHFVIYAQDRPDTLRRYAEQLERFDAVLRLGRGGLTEIPGNANRLTIYVLANASAVQGAMGARGSNVAGFYNGRAGASIAVTSREAGSGKLDVNPQIVLLHEYAHHFMLRNFPAAYPAWFREGFAEFYSTSRFEPDGAITIGLPANHRVYDLARTPDPNLALLLSDPGGRKGVDMSELYGWGWLVTHHLTFSQPRRGQLDRYVKAINAGTPAAQAATQAFGDLRAFERELKVALNRRKFAATRIPPADLATGAVALRDLGAGEQAVLLPAMRSRLGVDDRTAKTVAASLRRAAAPFPADPAVQIALAEAEYDVGALDQAEAAADRALAADPKALRALLYKARVRLKRAETAEAGPARTALVKEARSYVVRANRLDPDHPEPLLLFYACATGLGRPSANAIDGLVVAQSLAPEDDGVRLLAANQLVTDKRAAEARTLLNPLARAPHGGGMRDAAVKMLAALDAPGDTAAATAPAATR